MTPSTTSKELSERLKTLGVNQDSYFYWWESSYSGSYLLGTRKDAERWEEKGFADESITYTKVCAAFTAGELGEMLPKTIYDNGNLRCLVISHGQPTVQSWYVYYDVPAQEPDYKIGTEDKNLACAMGLMLAYLLTNGLLQADAITTNK